SARFWGRWASYATGGHRGCTHCLALCRVDAGSPIRLFTNRPDLERCGGMTDPDHAQRQETAAVVLYWMRRRGLTRQVFGDRMGKSLSWVDKIRAGDRQLDRLSVLRQIASVLDVPLAVLIDAEEAERRRSCPDDREIAAVRQALRRYDAITNVFRP